MEHIEKYPERIQEYQEEVEIIDEGIKAHQFNNDIGVSFTAIEKFKRKRDLFNLKLEKKTKQAAIATLSSLMQNAEAEFKSQLKHMKENFNKILKTAMDAKGNMGRKDKMLVLGIKDHHTKKNWQGDAHKLEAYKMLRNILQQNGKTI